MKKYTNRNSRLNFNPGLALISIWSNCSMECTHVFVVRFLLRDRPAPIPIEVKSIDDTSNFDEFPDLDMNFQPSGNAVLYTVKL